MERANYLCGAKGGCIALVKEQGDLCPAHYDQCGLCGHARRRHPVMQFTDEGPVTRCYEFQHQGMHEPAKRIEAI